MKKASEIFKFLNFIKFLIFQIDFLKTETILKSSKSSKSPWYKINSLDISIGCKENLCFIKLKSFFVLEHSIFYSYFNK